MKIVELHKQFVRECADGTIKQRSDRTIGKYVVSVNLLLKWFPIEHIDEVNEGIMRQFLAKGDKERRWKASSNVTYRTSLSAFFIWCVQGGYMTENPITNIPAPKILRKIPEIYSDQEIEKILYYSGSSTDKFIAVRNQAIIAMFVLTGLRKGELLGLRMDDVDFEND